MDILAPPLDRTEWTVNPLGDHSEAVNLMRLWHYAKGAPNTSTYRHGLFRVDQTLMAHPWGVALWIPPTRTAAESVAGQEWRRVLSLSRFVLDPAAPKNAASFLLSRSRKLIDRNRWPWLLTYADEGEGHTGAIYRADNWECLGWMPGADNWVGPNGEQRGRKRGGRTLTSAEMQSLGFVRKPAAGKWKFVHRTDSTKEPAA